MRKQVLMVFVGLMVMMCGMHVQAQSWSFNDKSDSKQNWFGIDLGVGSASDVDGTMLDLGFRYMRTFSPYIAWNAVNLKAIANTEDIGTTVTPQLMTGLRLTSPSFLNTMSCFAGAKVGYGFNIDSSEGGVCFEIEAGINLSRYIFVGYAYNNQDIDGFKSKYSALRIGFNL